MNIVSQMPAPLYDMGARLPRVRPRSTHTVRKPAYPLYEGWGLHGLGQEGPQILKAASPIAATAATAILTPVFSSGAAAGAGAAAGSWAGPIGAGIGVLVGVIAGLWAAHNARVAGAKQENQAINSALSTWDAGMKAIFNAANSSDPTINVSGAQAAAQVEQLYAQFWAQMSVYMHAPGTSDTSGGGVNCGSSQLNPAGPCAGEPGGHKCDKSCTATCCTGCQDLFPSMLQATQVLNSPTGGTVQVCAVASSSYGAASRSGYSLTYTPPTVLSSGISSSLSSLFGGTPGSSSSVLPLLAIAAVVLWSL